MTWRHHVARLKFYADNGRNVLQWAYQLAGAGAFARILLPPSVPTWAIVAAGPIVIVALAVLGYAHRRWGWLVEESSVAVTEEVSRPGLVTLEWLAKLLAAGGIPLNHTPPALRAEILDALKRRE